MKESEEDRGVITVLLERLEKQRLPRVRELKAKVDQGECLDELDMAFIQDILESSHGVEHLLERYPQYQDLAGRALNLYNEVITRALENEKAS